MLAYSTAEKRRGPLAQWNFEPKDLGDGGQRRECSLIPLNGTTILLSEFSLCLSHLIHILSFFFVVVPLHSYVSITAPPPRSIGGSTEIRAGDDEDRAFERLALPGRRSSLPFLQQSVQPVHPRQQPAQNSLRRYQRRCLCRLCVFFQSIVIFFFFLLFFPLGRVRGRDGSRDSINPPYINLPSPNVQDDVGYQLFFLLSFVMCSAKFTSHGSGSSSSLIVLFSLLFSNWTKLSIAVVGIKGARIVSRPVPLGQLPSPAGGRQWQPRRKYWERRLPALGYDDSCGWRTTRAARFGADPSTGPRPAQNPTLQHGQQRGHGAERRQRNFDQVFFFFSILLPRLRSAPV